MERSREGRDVAVVLVCEGKTAAQNGRSFQRDDAANGHLNVSITSGFRLNSTFSQSTRRGLRETEEARAGKKKDIEKELKRGIEETKGPLRKQQEVLGDSLCLRGLFI